VITRAKNNKPPRVRAGECLAAWVGSRKGSAKIRVTD
jgi:hypothetical protein